MKKVFVGMSGGVDSSVSAALLKEQGYDVTGVFIKVWQPDFIECNWKEDRRDAMRVAAQLEIPFLTFDFETEYKEEVVDYMIGEYKAGRTPNPDVMCNKYIKFGAFLEKAKSVGTEYVATGHYSQTMFNTQRSMFNLVKGKDKNKDQTYFLWTLTQEQLEHVLFPVGHLEKTEVRMLAKKFGLSTVDKKDSQGLCFVGKVDMKEFLAHFMKEKEGNVLDVNGNVIGKHRGALFYTIGERHGFSITNKGTDDPPFYVVAKDVDANTITVGDKIQNPENVTKIGLEKVSWISGEPDLTKAYTAQIRYRQEAQKVKVQKSPPARAGNSKIMVEFENAQSGVSLGQSVVIYDGEICLGGGIIESTQ